MKTKLTTILLALTATLVLAHEGVELGPNKGRILEFSTNETMHGEVAAKDGKLLIAILDKDMKPVKLEVTKSEGGFTITAPKSGEWLIVQYKEGDSAKPITARMHYDTKKCGTCEHVEWLCTCGSRK